MINQYSTASSIQYLQLLFCRDAVCVCPTRGQLQGSRFPAASQCFHCYLPHAFFGFGLCDGVSMLVQLFSTSGPGTVKQEGFLSVA